MPSDDILIFAIKILVFSFVVTFGLGFLELVEVLSREYA